MSEPGRLGCRFVPADARQAGTPLDAFLSPLPASVAEFFARAGGWGGEDTLFMPLSQSAAALLAVAEHGRVVASDPNPLTAEVQALLCSPPPPEAPTEVLYRLSDRLVRGRRLKDQIARLYQTSCPSCHRALPAEAFLWDREQDRPVQRLVRCAACGVDAWVGVSPEDQDRAASVRPKGYHYWRVLARLAHRGEDLYPRAKEFMALYTPRNLQALDTLIVETGVSDGRRAEGEEGIRQRLTAVMLLGCLERCSSLQPAAGHPLPRRLRPPRRFLEHNVWHALEREAAFWEAAAQAPPPAGSVQFRPGPMREALRLLERQPAAAALLAAPHPHTTFWHLCYFWACWLLGREAAGELRPLLALSTPAWTWYVRTLSRALGLLSTGLEEQAPLLIWLQQDRHLAEAVTLAATLAGWQPSAGAVQFREMAPRSVYGTPCILVFRRGVDRGQPPAAPEVAREAVLNLLTALDEPASRAQLWMAFYWALASAGALKGPFQATDDLPTMITDLEGTLHRALRRLMQDGLVEGLPSEREVEEGIADVFRTFWRRRGSWAETDPLSDRVERAVWQVLQAGGQPTAEEVAGAVYGQFRGLGTPPADWWEGCLQSYGEADGGRWHLRTEDYLERRRTEMDGLMDDLRRLGEALEFGVCTAWENLRLPHTDWAWSGDGRSPRPSGPLKPPFVVGWSDDEGLAYLFAFSWTSSAVPIMMGSAFGPPRAQRCLVVPGGRASLLHYRQTRAGWLPPVLEQGNWHFIKFRHLRQLARDPEVVSRQRLTQILGLDPIVERSDAQMPLF